MCVSVASGADRPGGKGEASKKQARQAKGGQSATQMYAYSQYIYTVPIVVAVDFDAWDAHLVEPGHAEGSKWLQQNAVVARLEEGSTFYEPGPERLGPPSDSLFAQNLRARRAAAAAEQ